MLTKILRFWVVLTLALRQRAARYLPVAAKPQMVFRFGQVPEVLGSISRRMVPSLRKHFIIRLSGLSNWEN